MRPALKHRGPAAGRYTRPLHEKVRGWPCPVPPSGASVRGSHGQRSAAVVPSVPGPAVGSLSVSVRFCSAVPVWFSATGLVGPALGFFCRVFMSEFCVGLCSVPVAVVPRPASRSRVPVSPSGACCLVPVTAVRVLLSGPAVRVVPPPSWLSGPSVRVAVWVLLPGPVGLPSGSSLRSPVVGVPGLFLRQGSAVRVLRPVPRSGLCCRRPRLSGPVDLASRSGSAPGHCRASVRKHCQPVIRPVLGVSPILRPTPSGPRQILCQGPAVGIPAGPPSEVSAQLRWQVPGFVV